MPSRTPRLVVAGLAATSLLAPATAAVAQGPADRPGPPEQSTLDLQLLSFNDFHGHLQPSDGLGGAAALAGTIDELRAEHGTKTSLVVSTGDIIGGSTFLSGMFQDEPAVEVVEAMDLAVSAVGNHEFDEGVDELLRMQEGGCHPDLRCFGDEPYDGADYPYLAANVVDRETGEPVLAPYHVEKVRGVKIGFIGAVTTDTAIMVSPSGIADVEFLDEAETINRYAAELQQQGVETIIALVHEGGSQDSEAGINDCVDLTGPITDLNASTTAEVDAIITGHTHDGYVCSLPDPAGDPRLVTQAANYGEVLSELVLPIDRATKDVLRERVTATNHAVTTEGPIDAEVAAIVDYWDQASEPIAARVVGTVEEDITGDASGDRGIETPMADLVADSILWGTSGDNGGAEIALMNVGGVRASLLVDDITNNEQPGEVTYAEAYEVAPFGNQLVTMDLTGAQLEQVLEQQYLPGRSREMLALGVSEGFSYTWDADANEVVDGSMTLNGDPVLPGETYRVATLNFLADGGDGFTVFTEGTNVTGGPEDLANLVAFLQAHPGLTAPEDRVTGL
ncbi:bifunctional metallophosphatase/5'-nucleotidase [Ornithinicoccus halotolerans]|uniref:bifunctional metallophosphatase/5'-nucleotidase n=1 Tax=Ornithinicoccus halotolerans TaxID=1748220 RepID=UPI00129699FE|nr:bifunctional metallophosphatase/5'-nucleotidase [Ornithinicoccus halotolerans]